MSSLGNALRAMGGRECLVSGEERIPANAILDRVENMERAFAPVRGCVVLSMDASPAVLLPLLVIAERHDCRLMLARASSSSTDLKAIVRPDVILHSAERIERVEASQCSGADAAAGVFLLTSGTTGPPKVVHQALRALLSRVQNKSLEKNRGARWLLSYEAHSFAGLQVVLAAALSGGLLIAPETQSPAGLAAIARAEGVTHISGTPTFWRALLMVAGRGGLPALRQITIGGEAVDQATLDRLAFSFPGTRISHIYASTEAGSLFAVHDGRAGFPREWLEAELAGGVRLRVRGEALEVRSPRAMLAYATGESIPLTVDGWLVTGDLVELEGERVIFRGRQDHIVNVGGLKVSPVEVESFLLSQPEVIEAQVYGVPSPLTGALLVARVVLRPGVDAPAILGDLRTACVRGLPRHKVPRRIEHVGTISVGASGKKALVP